MPHLLEQIEPVLASNFRCTHCTIALPLSTMAGGAYWVQTPPGFSIACRRSKAVCRRQNTAEHSKALRPLQSSWSSLFRLFDLSPLRCSRPHTVYGLQIFFSHSQTIDLSDQQRHTNPDPIMTTVSTSSNSGRIVTLMHDSAVLRDNPLGDPHQRKLSVYLPAAYDSPRTRIVAIPLSMT